MIKNKRGEELVSEQIIFFCLNILFFAILLLFIVKTSSNSAVLEETYSKNIALTIDSLRNGTSVTMDITKLYDKAQSNKYTNKPLVLIDDKNYIVNVKLSENSGYGFKYFSTLTPEISFNSSSKSIIIKVK